MGLIEDAAQIKLAIKEQIRERTKKHSILKEDHSRILDEIIDLILANVGIITPVMLKNLPLIDTLAELAAADLPDWGGYRTSSGFVKLKTPSVPVFIVQPIGGLIEEGAPINLISNATGSPAYQWYKDGVLIPGANSSSLVIDLAKESDSGVYTVVATNEVGEAVSNAVTVVVGDEPERLYVNEGYVNDGYVN